MHQDSTHRQDLNQLIQSICTILNSLKKIFPQQQTLNISAQPTKSSSVPKKLEKLQKYVQNLVRYSLHILQFAQKSEIKNKQTQQQLNKRKRLLNQTLKRMIGLQDQTLILRKQLNIRQQEIEKLKQLNKINASYESSIQMKDCQRQHESQKEQKSVENYSQEKSYNSIQQSQQLNSYDSDDQWRSQKKFQQQQMVIDQIDGENMDNLIDLLQGLTKIVSFQQKQQKEIINPQK